MRPRSAGTTVSRSCCPRARPEYQEQFIGKTSADEPFALTPAQEKRLVDLGVAEYVGPVDTMDIPANAEEIPEYDIDMKVDKLREIAKQMGLTFPVGTTKAEMVEAMDKFQAENAENGVDADDIEDDGEEPPAYDPTEAVER